MNNFSIQPKVLQLELDIPIRLQNILNKLSTHDESKTISPFFVGGMVRDAVMNHFVINGIRNRRNKDIDIEVFGVSLKELLSFLQEHFTDVSLNGKSFGVITVQDEELGAIDFSLPRWERSIGAGHQDFEVGIAPDMPLDEAAKRRDFTMNAMFCTPNGQVLDFFDGIRDIKWHQLKAVSTHFIEDPLRILRAMQFASRFNMTADVSVFHFAEKMREDFNTLSKERISEEWLKWAKGDFPHKGLDLLRLTGWHNLFPGLVELINVPQDEEWHPEGDVWTHVLEVLRATVAFCKANDITGQKRTRLIFGALSHDLGKVKTTIFSEGRWRAPGHDDAGIEPARKLGNALFKVDGQKDESELTKVMIESARFHMRRFEPGTKISALRRLANSLEELSVEELTQIMICDASGRPFNGEFHIPATVSIIENLVNKTQEDLLHAKPEPIVQGRHIMIIRPEVKPGKIFGIVLRQAFEAQLDSVFENEEDGIIWLENNIDAMAK